MLSAIPSGAGALHQQGQVHRAQHMNLHQIKLNSNLHSTCNCFSNCVEKQEEKSAYSKMFIMLHYSLLLL